ncbi:glycosyltransferase family 4 protein [Microvirga sp. SRT01]|uniref:Glycosyltransferase family 4 protein n=1 Tax=Sphingomonas longa TaxID=2778730 RepID=A0ABS2D960_9SPHN|nr:MULTISPECIES: glycosyltransferase family 1 protein [Alphaproteobacteria]MBM6577470.1 glycosyltransferase family 4 protein [Sphingomonas sp. BT552]MBR7710515.1 glycosyltransferase family 4 protein [Microvirga sp. SRT01]
MPIRPRLFLNGKFYSGATNGVHRVADRLLRELDRAAVAGGTPARWDMRLLLPEVPNWAPSFTAIRTVPQRAGHTQRWEQMILPVVARGGVLASFANLGPAWHPRKVTMVHDAQFRLSPDSYPAKLRWGYRALVPRGARSSRIVLTVSDYARDSLATFGIADHAATRVIHNGGDHILEQPADEGVLARHGLAGGRYALMFGSAARYKNIGVVLAAFARPDMTDRTLAIIGPPRQALVAAGLAVPPNAVFVGGVDDAGLRALYENAHALLYPSRTEGFGLPPVEAMLCDCPVVAAPAGAIPEIGRDAILYAGMDSPADWAAAVHALDDPALRAMKIAAGRTRGATFTWAAAGATLAAILDEQLAA